MALLMAKMSSSPVFWIFYLILSPLTSPSMAMLLSLNKSAMPDEQQQQQQQQAEPFLGSDEPLLRFSFAKFLANPCGLMSSSSSTAADFKGEEHSPPPTSSSASISSTGDLSKEVLQLLDPFRQQYYNLNRSLFSTEERVVIIEEFLLVLQEVKYRIKLLQPSMDLHSCDHIQLASLPNIERLINGQDELDVKEIYRALAITAAHLHLITRNLYSTGANEGNKGTNSKLPLMMANHHYHQSRRVCHSVETNPLYQQNVQILTGKVETLMCLIFPMRFNNRLSSASSSSSSTFDGSGSAAADVDDDDTSPEELFQVIHSVLQTQVHHNYNDCSARDTRRCLVVRYANRVFGVVFKLGNNQRRQLERVRKEEYKRKYCGGELLAQQHEQ